MNIPYKSIYYENDILIVDNSEVDKSNKLQGQIHNYMYIDECTKYNEGTLEFNTLSVSYIFDIYNRLRNDFPPTHIYVTVPIYDEINAYSGIYFSGTFEDLY